MGEWLGTVLLRAPGFSRKRRLQVEGFNWVIILQRTGSHTVFFLVLNRHVSISLPAGSGREKGRDRDEGLPRSPGALNAVQSGPRRAALLAGRYPFERSIKRDIC